MVMRRVPEAGAGVLEPGQDLSIAATMQAFMASLQRQNRAQGTIDTYWHAGLSPLARFLESEGCAAVTDLTKGHLERWQDWERTRPRQRGGTRLKPKSRSLASTAVRSWLRYLIDEELVADRLLRVVKPVHVPKLLPKPIPLADLERVQAHLAMRRPSMTESELRDRALFTFLLVTAARISEALRLTRDDIESGADVVVVQKGGSEKLLLMTPTLREYLDDYLAVRRDGLPDLWVTTEVGPRRAMKNHQVQLVWRRLAEAVGVRRFTSHQLRHTCATELRRAGVGDLVIAQHLGHANLATLPNYAAVVDEERQVKLEVLEGLLQRGVDRNGPDQGRFRRPVRVGGRPDRRSRRQMR